MNQTEFAYWAHKQLEPTDILIVGNAKRYEPVYSPTAHVNKWRAEYIAEHGEQAWIDKCRESKC